IAFEPPSAGFALDWHTLAAWRERGIGLATLTHAAGISSTGDWTLDLRLPFDEPYSLRGLRRQSNKRSRKVGASSPSELLSSARLSLPLTLTAPCAPETALREDASCVKPRSGSSTRSSPACTNTAKATSSFREPSRAMLCWTRPIRH